MPSRERPSLPTGGSHDAAFLASASASAAAAVAAATAAAAAAAAVPEMQPDLSPKPSDAPVGTPFDSPTKPPPPLSATRAHATPAEVKRRDALALEARVTQAVLAFARASKKPSMRSLAKQFNVPRERLRNRLRGRRSRLDREDDMAAARAGAEACGHFTAHAVTGEQVRRSMDMLAKSASQLAEDRRQTAEAVEQRMLQAMAAYRDAWEAVQSEQGRKTLLLDDPTTGTCTAAGPSGVDVSESGPACREGSASSSDVVQATGKRALSMRSLAKEYNVPRERLRRRLHGCPSRADRAGANLKLGDAQNRALRRYLAEIVAIGAPPLPKLMAQAANDLLAQHAPAWDPATPSEHKAVGVSWATQFIKKHTLASSSPSGNNPRPPAQLAQFYFRRIASVLASHPSMTPDDLWRVSVRVFQVSLGDPLRLHEIPVQSDGRALLPVAGEKDFFVTVVDAANAAGTAIPPLITAQPWLVGQGQGQGQGNSSHTQAQAQVQVHVEGQITEVGRKLGAILAPNAIFVASPSPANIQDEPLLPAVWFGHFAHYSSRQALSLGGAGGVIGDRSGGQQQQQQQQQQHRLLLLSLPTWMSQPILSLAAENGISLAYSPPELGYAVDPLDARILTHARASIGAEPRIDTWGGGGGDGNGGGGAHPVLAGVTGFYGCALDIAYRFDAPTPLASKLALALRRPWADTLSNPALLRAAFATAHLAPFRPDAGVTAVHAREAQLATHYRTSVEAYHAPSMPDEDQGGQPYDQDHLEHHRHHHHQQHQQHHQQLQQQRQQQVARAHIQQGAQVQGPYLPFLDRMLAQPPPPGS